MNERRDPGRERERRDGFLFATGGAMGRAVDLVPRIGLVGWILSATLLSAPAAVASERCITADAGGVAVFPPTASTRGFESVAGAMMINAGGANVVVGDLRLRNLTVTGIAPAPGGLQYDFTCTADMAMQGGGAYLGFLRTLSFAASGRLFAADQVPGQRSQDIVVELRELSGSAPPGDPDFALLSITAGTTLGLPGTGRAQMVRLPSGSWAVEATLDAGYRIDHVGSPTSLYLSGLVGSTTSETRLRDGVAPRRAYGAPDAGGTATFPPACDDPFGLQGHRSQWFVPVMTSGMPAGSTVFGDLVLRRYVVVSQTPGGSYGGQIQQFTAECQLDLFGTGAFGAYRRRIAIPVSGTSHTGPRALGAAVQGFPSEIVDLHGQINADPDFSQLAIVAGAASSRPSPGHTTLRQLPGGGWLVDGFLDLDFRIDFAGRSGGPFAGFSGSNAGSAILLLGEPENSLCLAPDIGGTARFPADCASGYQGPLSARVALGGLPTGSPLLGTLALKAISVTQTSGGALGGNAQSFSGMIDLQLTGVGVYAGYSRSLTIPISGQSASAPRGGSATPQSFEADLVSVFGQVSGDPDFSLFRITAGSAFGMPSPGHTVFTRQGASWVVDSYFDLTYQIEFNGTVGGPFSGLHSVTRSANRFQAGAVEMVAVEAEATPALRIGTPFPNPARGASRLTFELPRPARVEAVVFDLSGRRVCRLLQGELPAGVRTLVWNGCDASGRAARAGLYFLALDVDGRRFERRIALAR